MSLSAQQSTMLSINIMRMILCVLLGILPSIIHGLALPSCDSPTFSPNETVQADRAIVYMYSTCDTTMVANNTRIYYTTDGIDPVVDVSRYLQSGESIVIKDFGWTTIRALTIADTHDNSKVVKKSYEIIPSCDTPSIYPNGDTWSGSVTILIQADKSSSVTYQVYNAATNSQITHNVVAGGDDVIITFIGTFYIKLYAERDSCFKSAEFKSNVFTVNPQVSNPVITPSDNIYTISARLFFSCSTPSAIIHYTTDGSDPSRDSLIVENTKSITIETIGDHTIKAIAIASGFDDSDIVTKELTILTRAAAPVFTVSSSYPSTDSRNYIGNIKVTLSCEDGGIVYYTTDVSTPTMSSPTTMCNTYIELKAPGSYTLRAFTFITDRSVSDIIEGKYVLTRPSCDAYDVHIEVPFQVQPVVDTYVVEASLPPSHYFCDDRIIRGRLLQLYNPIGHFDFVQPSNSRGCQERKLELPSVTGRSYNTSTSAWLLYKNSTAFEKNRNKLSKEVYGFTYTDAIPTYYPYEDTKLAREIRRNISLWQEEYAEIADLGCQLVTNAGFFNTSTNNCVGDIVENGDIIQTSSKHNVNFGIRNGKYMIGYIDERQIRDVTQPFDTLVSGIVWLVRDGESYVAESLSKSGDGEDLSSQSTGSSFATVLSARTCIGYDEAGNLLILQVEGKTWERGMSLYEFADFAIELGFVAAINLDGGGSATMTVNHTLVSEPSWDCTDSTIGIYKCEKQVSTITCIHAMQPPQVAESMEAWTTKPSASPTLFPTYTWERELDDDHDDTTQYDDGSSSSNSTTYSASELQETLVMYKESTAVLGVLLILSLFANYFYYNKKESNRFHGGVNMPGVSSGDVEMSSRGQSHEELSTPKTESRVPAFFNSFKGVSLMASPSPASTNSGQRSPLHPSSSNDWQSKLRNMNFEQDSSDEEAGSRGVAVDSIRGRVTDSKKGRRKSNKNDEETIHLYNHNGTNDKKEKRRSSSNSASKIIETISKKASASIVMSKGQPSSAYSRLGSSDEEEPADNPFK